MNPEAKFQWELKQSFEIIYGSDCYWLKMPDFPVGGQDRQSLPEHLRFNPPKRWDIVAVIKGIPFAIETKVIINNTYEIPFKCLSVAKETSYPNKQGKIIHKIKLGQMEHLEDASKAGYKSFVLVLLQETIAVFVPINEWIKLRNELTQLNINKFKYPNKENYIVKGKMINEGKTIWHVKDFIDKIAGFPSTEQRGLEI